MWDCRISVSPSQQTILLAFRAPGSGSRAGHTLAMSAARMSAYRPKIRIRQNGVEGELWLVFLHKLPSSLFGLHLAGSVHIPFSHLSAAQTTSQHSLDTWLLSPSSCDVSNPLWRRRPRSFHCFSVPGVLCDMHFDNRSRIYSRF